MQYSYNYIPKKNSPDFEFGLTEDFVRSDLFFSELENFAYSFNIYIYNLDLYLMDVYSNEISGEEEINDEMCVKVNVDHYKNVSLCLYTYDGSMGSEKLMSIALILNYYYSFSSTDFVDNFLDFLYDLKISCSIEYTINCISDVLIAHGTVPNLDAYIIYQHNTDISFRHYFYKINDVSIFTSGIMKTSYIIGNKNKVDDCNFY